MKWMFLKFKQGFTMSELLIGLGILGLIAAFSVPKLLNVSNAALANAKVHKSAQAVVNGLERWTQENGRSANTTPADIMSVVQHNGRITSGTVDWVPGSADYTCVASTAPSSADQGNCYRMPDGSVLYFLGDLGGSDDFNTFGGNSFNALYFGIDPDGIATDDISQANTSLATAFLVYRNGRLRERGRLKGTFSLQPESTPTYYQQ